MIERQMELKRRYTRKEKMRKYKKKLATATGEAREKLLYKIKRLSPFWTEANLTGAKPAAAAKEPREPKRKPAAKAAPKEKEKK